MKIAFDAQPLAYNQKTGVGYCAAGMIDSLINHHPEHQYQLSFFAFNQKAAIFHRLAPFCKQNVILRPCFLVPGQLYRIITTFLPIPYHWFFGSEARITHFYNFIVPPGVKGLKICTVHDMAYQAFPETVRFRTRKMLELTLEASCRRADRIITVSQFSKDELMKYLAVPAEKISVVPNGVDLTVFHPDYAYDKIHDVMKKYQLPDRYFLYLGTLEPRKNWDRLIEAYGLLRRRLSNAPTLVLAGRKGWLYDSIFETVKKLGLEDQVIFTDYIPDEDKPLLLCGAEAFVFPSLYEGFGMPPLEAMACGIPVLTSAVSSLPEVTGDAALLVDPSSVEGLADGLFRLASEPALRKDLAEKGLLRAKEFTWAAAAELLHQIYEELAFIM